MAWMIRLVRYIRKGLSRSTHKTPSDERPRQQDHPIEPAPHALASGRLWRDATVSVLIIPTNRMRHIDRTR